MMDIKALWKETRELVHSREKEIVEKYVHFLREVARHYISKGKRVFFRENRVVHYGEGGFGWLTIECDDDAYEVFGDYVSDISLVQKLSEWDMKRSIEITEENVEAIKYEI